MFAASLIAEFVLIGTGFEAVAILVGAALLLIYFVNRQKDRRKTYSTKRAIYSQNLVGLLIAACFTGSPGFDSTSFMYSVNVTKR